MKFYKLSKDLEYKYIDYAENTDWESITCPKYPGHQHAGNRFGNLEIKLHDERKRDFYWTFLSELVISDHLASLLKANEVTGYELKPVKIINKKREDLYWEFIPKGNGGDSDNYKLVYACEFCDHKYYRDVDEPEGEKFTKLKRVIVNKNNWDGSDVFTVNGLIRYILITERLKDIIVENKLKGAIIVPVEDLENRIYPETSIDSN